MVKVTMHNEEQQMTGKELLQAIIQEPEALTEHLNEQMRRHAEGLMEHIKVCASYDYPEHVFGFAVSGYQAVMNQFGLEKASEMVQSDGVQADQLFFVRKVSFEEEYVRGFCHQIDLHCSWSSLATGICSKAYVYGLLDGESICKLLEVE